MKFKLLITIFFLAMIPDQKKIDTKSSSTHFIIHPLAKGIWAAINRESNGSHAICNAGIIDLGDKTVVVDPFMNIDAAEDLKKVAKELTGRETTYVINTHCHNDHIRGNQVFLPATIISTEWTKNQIALTEPQELKWEKENAATILKGYKKRESTAMGLDKKELPLWINYFEGIVLSNSLVKTTLPNQTFNGSMLISGSQRNLLLKEYKNAHTESDAVVFIPSEKILFAGDMFFNKAHPWLSDGNPDSLKSYLMQFVNDVQIKKIVPGHGSIGDKKDIHQMIQYINVIQKMVLSNQEKGVPDSIILKLPIPDPYKDWTFGSRFYEANLQFLLKNK